MKPILKKAAAALAVKEGIERLQDLRKPKKPSVGQRLKPFSLVAIVAGLGFLLVKSRAAKGNSESNYSGSPSNTSRPTSTSATGGSF